MPRPLPREEYTVGWICALPIELAAAQEMLDEEHGSVQRFDNDDNLYYLGSIAGHNVVIACLPAGRIGNSPAAAVATQTRATFPGIRFGLMVGVGGGVPSEEADIRLGDVVVSQPQQTFGGVVQYDIGKATPSGFQRTGLLNSPPHMLLVALSSVQANEARGRSTLSQHIAKLDQIPKFRRRKAGIDVLFDAAYDHKGGQTCDKCNGDRKADREPRENEEEVVVHYGTIASGNQVIRNATERDRVSDDLGGVLCFEMEAAGLMNTFPCLVIRGICDYADSHKNNKWRPFAAATASSYAKEVLSVIPVESNTYTVQKSIGKASKHYSQQSTGPPTKRRKLDHFEDPGRNSLMGKETLTLSQIRPFTETSIQMSPQEKDCLRSLSFPEQEQRYNNIHTAIDTCKWLLEDPQYQAWLEKPRGLFWIKGNPGSGKSVLMKYAVKHLRKIKPGELIVSFFIHGRGSDLQKTQLGLFRALLSSLLEDLPDYLAQLATRFEARERRHGSYIEERWKWTDTELQEFLAEVLTKRTQRQPVIIFIDALDECGEGPAKCLIAYFKDLAKQAEREMAQVKICFSSRHYPILSLNTIPAVYVEERNDQDIRWYTRDRLKDTRIGHKRQQIEDEILLKARGGFQWVLLVTEMVTDGNLKGIRPEKLLNELASCPGTLSELYASILNGVSGDEQRQMVKLFQWVLFAERPLSAQELRDALATDKDMSFTTIAELRTYEGWSGSLDNFERHVQSISRGLVEFQTREVWEKYEIDGEDSNREAQFIHQSVADYLLDKFLVPKEDECGQCKPPSSIGVGHFQISRSCLKYLTLREVLENTRIPRGALSSKFPLAPYATQHIFKHVQKVEEEGVVQHDLLSVIRWEPQSQTIRKLADLWGTLDPDNVHRPIGWPFVGATEFHVLVAFGSKSAFALSLESNDMNINGRDSDGNTPLTLALRENHQDIAMTLLDRYAIGHELQKEEPGQRTSDGTCNERREPHHIYVNAKNNDEDTALNIALDQEAGGVIMKLIEVGANPEYLGQETALVQYAIRSRNKMLLLRLIEKNVSLDGAVYFAVDNFYNEDRLLEELITELAKAGRIRTSEDEDEAESENKDEGENEDAVILASRRGLASVVKLLVSQGVLETHRNKSRGFPLLVAAENGHDAVVKVLLLKTRKTEVNWRDKNGQTPLWVAAANGYERVVKLLLDTGDADVDSMDNDGYTPLWTASHKGHEAVVKLLLNTRKADINWKNRAGWTPLRVAVANVHKTIVKLLLDTGEANVDSMDNDEYTPLWRASEKGHEAIVQLLLKTRKADVNWKVKDGQTPLCVAATNGHETVVKLLLDTGEANVDSMDNDGYTPLWRASEKGHKTIVQLLLETRKADVNWKVKGGQTPLCVAATKGHKTVVKLLLDTGEANVDSMDNDGYTPLWRASEKGHKTTVQLLLETRKANVNWEVKDGQTPLCVAATNGHETVVKLLLDTGDADVNSMDNFVYTPLWRASYKGHEAVVKLLLRTGKADVDWKGRKGRTPLWAAADKGHETVVKLLLNTGEANVNSKDNNGYTPLWRASERGHEEIVQLLLKTRKANVNWEVKDGRTPLWVAATNGHETVVKLLLDIGEVDVNSMDNFGCTPLWRASYKGHEAVVKLLLGTGKADVDWKGRKGRTSLWAAAANGHEAVVKLLFVTGEANVESMDENGQTPLSRAALNGHLNVVNFLLETGNITIDWEGYYEQTPLLRAAYVIHRERSWKMFQQNSLERESMCAHFWGE